MRLVCNHGYYMFYPENEADVSNFFRYRQIELFKKDDYYTFKELLDLENYSLQGHKYSNAVAIKNFEGSPWEVMRANKLVYSLLLKSLVPVESITLMNDFTLSNDVYLTANNLPQAGAFDSMGRVLSFDAVVYRNDTIVRYFDYE